MNGKREPAGAAEIARKTGRSRATNDVESAVRTLAGRAVSAFRVEKATPALRAGVADMRTGQWRRWLFASFVQLLLAVLLSRRGAPPRRGVPCRARSHRVKAKAQAADPRQHWRRKPDWWRRRCCVWRCSCAVAARWPMRSMLEIARKAGPDRPARRRRQSGVAAAASATAAENLPPEHRVGEGS